MPAPDSGGAPRVAAAPDAPRLTLSPSARERLQRRSPKRSELIARHIANYIVDNHLPPGTALPPEREMVALLDVGRTTLREALRILESRGVLTVRSGSGGGPVVRRPHLEDLGRSLSLTLQFAGASLSDVIQARMLLESSIARAAAEHISDEQVLRLRALDEHLATAGQRHEHEFVAGNAAYHALVAEACGNVVLRIFLAALSSIADGRAAGVRIGPELRRAAAADHARITDALERRDPDAAERAVRAHLAATYDFWVRDFGDVIARPIRWAIG